MRWIITTAGAIALAAGAVFAPSPSAAEESGRDAERRRLWAYPDGVLVTNGGAESPAGKHEPTQGALDRLTERLEEELRACARRTRAERPDLATKGEKWLFNLTFDLTKSGAPSDVRVRKLVGSADLPECVAALPAKVASETFPDRSKVSGRPGKDAWVNISLQVVVLTDEEAQGRGYQYFVAEREWERALRDNAKWFACERTSDCIITYEMCEVRAINARYETEFLDAVRRRKRTSCREPERPQVLRPVCRNKVCGTADAAAP